MVTEFSRRTGYAPSIGMRDTSTWNEDEVPKGYRDGVNYLWPNGKATLTGLLDRAKKVRESQSHFTWFEKRKLAKSSTGTSSDGAVVRGDSITVTIADDFKNMVREGHEILLRDADDHSKDVLAKVKTVTRTSTPSLTASVITATGNLSTIDRMLIVGNINPEASTRPVSISYNGYERDNYQQIWRNSFSMTRTDLRNKSRLKERYAELKSEAYQDHAEEQEGAFLWGTKDIYMGDNGKPERVTGGIIPFIKEYASDNYIDCTAVTALAGKSFLAGGLELLEDYLIRPSFDWGEGTEKIVFAGNRVLSAIQNLIRSVGSYQIYHNEKAYGINVSRIDTPFGSWLFHRYTPFNVETSLQRSLLAFEMDQLVFHYTDDFHFEKDEHFGKGGGSGLDGLVEAFLTEGGLEIQFPEKMIYAYNFGENFAGYSE